MNSLNRIVLTTVFAALLLNLAGCDGKVSEEAARKAGETLKKWQDQNR